MTFSVTTETPSAVLKKIPQIGAYSFEAWKGFNKRLGSWLFGDELFGINTSKSVGFKNMKIDATTSQDGKTVEWSTIAMRRLATTTSTGASGTVKTVGSTKGFSAGDQIIIESSTGVETYAQIATVDTTTQITLSASATTVSGDIVKRLSSSKRTSGLVDRVDFDPTRTKQSNNFQVFQAKFWVTDETLNSHMDLYFRGWQPSPEAAKMTAGERMLDGINNYLQMKTSQKLGNEIFGDIASAFFKGKKLTYTDGASAVRQYAGGLAEVVDTVSISGSDEGDAILDQIWSAAYDVYQYAGAYGNERVVLVCNAAFKKKFGTLRQNNVTIQLTAAATEFGYGLEKVNFPQFENIYVAYEPSLDDSEINAPVAYVIPLDLIGAFRRTYRGINEDMEALNWPADILIKKSVTDEDTMDTVTLLMTYTLTFIFGGADSVDNFGSGKGLYKRLVIA